MIAIDRTELVNRLGPKWGKAKLFQTIYEIPTIVIGDIDSEADAAAEWIDTAPGEKYWWQLRFKCRACGEMAFLRTRFCGNCGRKMRLRE